MPARKRQGGGGGGGIPRAALLGVVLALVFGALYVVGQVFDDGTGEDEPVMTTETAAREPAEERARTTKKKPAAKKPAASRVVRLQIVPTAPVSVCLVNINGDVLVANETLQPGQPSETFRSKRFRLVLGNSGARLKINGKDRTIPATTGPVAYTITRNGRSDLPESRRPTCAG